jgi:hypothetical protein
MHKVFSDTLFCVEHLNGIAAWQGHVQVNLIVWFVCWLTATSGHFSASAASALHLSSMGLRDFIGMFASTMFELFKNT